MSTSPKFAFVTLVTTDHYLPGALVVAAALRDVHPSPPVSAEELDPTEFHTVCLVTPETVDVHTVKLLRKAFDVVIGVEIIEAETEEGLRLLGRPDLRTVLTKLHVFRLTSYHKLIFLDADVLPLRPLSHLFHISSTFAAVPDVGWPDIFNSGFLVLEPGEDKFKEVMDLVKSKGSWDGGDQGVLNEWKGQDWERLSFTYNTTPTAAYTYAPAYKRFGPQISNIHFIGPEKPWTQIPFRAPGATSSTSLPAPGPSQAHFAPPPSYAYPALLDRWFAVYDLHYRSPHSTSAHGAIAEVADAAFANSAGEFAIQRYESLWDSGVRSTVGAEVKGSGAPMGLEELRRVAVEGVGESEASDTQGVYRSLPLEGRVDLMRQKKHAPAERKEPPLVVHIQVPEAEGPCTPTRSRSPAPMTTLPTPGPNEFPPTPVFRGHSLPPETPTHARATSPSQHYLGVQPQPASPFRVTSPLHLDSPRHPVSPARPASPHRPVSPPLLPWNPAIEAPPTTLPPASHFPEQTYFPNVWDAPAQHQHTVEESEGFFHMPPPPIIPERLIREGHYKAVIGEVRQEAQHEGYSNEQPHGQEEHQERQHEEHQSQQPHYEHHLHQYHQPPPPPLHPQPDRSKIVSVFPWEEKPRHAPNRVFPSTDSPPPGQPFIEPQPPALKLDLHPLHSPPPVTSPPQPPVHGFPRTTTYANAWDVVPSIQRYASRLVRPAPVSSAPLLSEGTVGTGRSRKGSAATAGGDEYRSWQDRVEVSSRDADDEDEDDEDDEDPSPPSVGAESDVSDGLGERPPRTQKKYQGKGVQTMPKEVRHQGIQVQNGNGNGKRAPRSGSGNGGSVRERGSAKAKEKDGHVERAPAPKLNRGLPQEMRVHEQMATGSPAVNAPGFMLPLGTMQGQPPQQQHGSPNEDRPLPTGALSPRLHDAYAFGQPARQGFEDSFAASRNRGPAVPELSPPVVGSLTVSAAAEQVASPPSSLGPSSPPEGFPILADPLAAHMPKPVGRAFDPAREVDLFKRGSEEVLARFLRMGSWSENPGSGPPSAA